MAEMNIFNHYENSLISVVFIFSGKHLYYHSKATSIYHEHEHWELTKQKMSEKSGMLNNAIVQYSTNNVHILSIFDEPMPDTMDVSINSEIEQETYKLGI